VSSCREWLAIAVKVVQWAAQIKRARSALTGTALRVVPNTACTTACIKFEFSFLNAIFNGVGR
jgi:hypothetical protein